MTSPDNCFDEMAKVLFPRETSSDVGYIRLLEEVKRIKNIADENKKLKNKLITANKKLKEEQEKNKERNKDLLDFRSLCDRMALPWLTADCLAEEMKNILEEQVEKMKDTFASLNSYKECNKELQKKVDEIPTLLEEERYKERSCNERDYEDYEENVDELQEEVDELKKENKTLEEIHSGDMKIVKMLKEKWNEEQVKVKKLKEELKDATEDEEGHYNGRKEAQEEYEKVAYEMCESRLHANDPILMAQSAKLLHMENNKLKEENEELKETYFQRGFDAGKEEYEVDTELLNEIKEQRDFFNQQFHKTLQCQAEDTEEYEKQIKEIKEENKKLAFCWQEKFDEKEHWGHAVRDYMDYGDHWCHFDEWLRENIDEDDKKQEWVKIWMESIGYEEEEEEEEEEETLDKIVKSNSN